MLTKRDLLTYGIKIPDEEQKVEMALPPEIGKGNNKSSKKDKKLFSKAIFKESLKSNRLALTIVSICNALIMVVVICILSTLHINSTSDALRDLFSNANTETTLKSGAIYMYASYTNVAESYDTINESQDTLENTVTQSLDTVDDSSLNSTISTVKVAYDTAYKLSSGTEEEKNASAKKTTMTLVNTYLSTSDKSDTEKEIAKNTISYFFDIYAQDKTLENRDILIKALPYTMADAVASQMELSDDKKTEVLNIFTTAFDDYFNNSVSKDKVVFVSALDLMAACASEEQNEFITSLVNKLKDEYNNNSNYLIDETIQNNIVSTELQNYVFEMVNSFAYYEYLPSFTVQVLTSDRGYPIQYVSTGKYAENGEEIKVEQEIYSYNPSLYVEVTGDMGTVSNLLEKMHKDVITGEGYTDEEIAQAKAEAETQLSTLKETLSSFMSEYIVRDSDNKNKYYDGSKVDTDAIEEMITDYLVDQAEVELINSYNEDHDVKVSSLDEITRENYSMSGEEMLTTVKGYVNSGIASYKSYYQTCENKGYSQTDCLLVASVKGSLGVINQLPGMVSDSLSEMGDMNTYGIMVGVIGLGIACLLIPMVYTIMLSDSLVSNKVETGSLAFTLATPTRRICFVFTQGMYLLFSELVMGLSLLVAGVLTQIIGVALGGSDLLTSLPVRDICLYTLGNFMISLAISGICFLASCIFNKSHLAIAYGGGLSIYFFVASILGLFGSKAIPGTIRIDAMNFFNYITIVSLYDPIAVMDANYLKYSIKLVALLVISLVTYTLGMIRFTKKDLPL